ncbi:hypothetical protein MYX82_03260 [Acidobacteria bacterium AH-259-D05]|nr:hypothetical protein [Acidobacteria bacterium AH-259-D05]
MLRVRKEGIKPKTLLSIGIFPDAVQFKDGFNFTVSESHEFEKQLRDSEAFLKTNSKEYENLSAQLQPEAPVLDFGLWRNDGPAQSVTFPSSLVTLAGGLGFELCVSLYEVSDL